jgi:hypothetical protein
MAIAASRFSTEPTSAGSPDLLDRFAALERIVAEQGTLIEAQDARIRVLEAADEDGAVPRSPGKWLRVKAAADETGYSESGLRKMVRERRCVVDFEGCHPLINVNSIPDWGAKVRK